MKTKLYAAYLVICVAVIVLVVVIANRERFIIENYYATRTEKTNMTPAELEAEYAKKEKMESEINAEGVTDEYIREVVLENKPTVAIHVHTYDKVTAFKKDARLTCDTDNELIISTLDYIESRGDVSNVSIVSTYADVNYAKIIISKGDETWTYVGTKLGNDENLTVYYVLGD